MAEDDGMFNMGEPSHSRDTNSRQYLYKTKGLTEDEMRKRRREDVVQIRKQKRNELLSNRRKNNDSITYEDSSCFVTREMYDSLIVRCADGDACLVTLSDIVNTMCAESSEKGAFILEFSQTKLLIPALADIIGEMQGRRCQLACWILVNMFRNQVSSDREDTMSTLNVIMEELKKPWSFMVCEQLICAIWHGMGGYPGIRNTLIAHGLISVLEHVYNRFSDNAEDTRMVTWMLANICQQTYRFPPSKEGMSPLWSLLCKALASEEQLVCFDVVRACTHLAENSDFLQCLFDCGLLGNLVDRLHPLYVHADEIPSILLILAFCTQESSAYTRALLDRGVLKNLKEFVDRSSLSQEICFIISNITAEGETNVHKVIESGILEKIVHLMEADYNTRKEACYVIVNCALSPRAEHLAILLDLKVLGPLSDFLTMMDLELVSDVLDALSAFFHHGQDLAIGRNDMVNVVCEQFEEVGGKEKLIFLAESESQSIQLKAFHLLDSFFDVESCEGMPLGASGDVYDFSSGVRGTIDDAIESVLRNIQS